MPTLQSRNRHDLKTQRHRIKFKNWEKLNRGFPNRAVSDFFSGKVQIVSWTLSGLFLVGPPNRPRERQRTNRENPRSIPEQIGKIPEKSGKSQEAQKRTKKPLKWRLGAGRLLAREYFNHDQGRVVRLPMPALPDCSPMRADRRSIRSLFWHSETDILPAHLTPFLPCSLRRVPASGGRLNPPPLPALEKSCRTLAELQPIACK